MEHLREATLTRCATDLKEYGLTEGYWGIKEGACWDFWSSWPQWASTCVLRGLEWGTVIEFWCVCSSGWTRMQTRTHPLLSHSKLTSLFEDFIESCSHICVCVNEMSVCQLHDSSFAMTQRDWVCKQSHACVSVSPILGKWERQHYCETRPELQ